MEAQQKVQFPLDISVQANVGEFVLCPKTYLDEKIEYEKELLERIENMKNEAAYTLNQKNEEIVELVARSQLEAEEKVAEGDRMVKALREKLVDQQAYWEEVTSEMTGDREKQVSLLDAEQESKLSKEYEKQSRLMQENVVIREKAKLDLLSLEEQYEREMEQLKKHNEQAFSEWRGEYEKVVTLLKADGLKFEEALAQTEEEYETEVGALLDGKREALSMQSELYNDSVRDAVSLKNNITGLQRRVVGREEELVKAAEDKETLKKKLNESVRVFEKAQNQLKERDRVIRVKDEALAKLRSNQKHLESFRFVLSQKVLQLEKAKDPLESQVGELRSLLNGIHGEMVADLRKKQALENRNAEAKLKITNLAQEGSLFSRNLKVVQKDFLNLLGDLAELSDPSSSGSGSGGEKGGRKEI